MKVKLICDLESQSSSGSQSKSTLSRSSSSVSSSKDEDSRDSQQNDNTSQKSDSSHGSDSPRPPTSFPTKVAGTTDTVRLKCRELLMSALKFGGRVIIWECKHAYINWCSCVEYILFFLLGIISTSYCYSTLPSVAFAFLLDSISCNLKAHPSWSRQLHLKLQTFYLYRHLRNYSAMAYTGILCKWKGHVRSST